LEGNHERKTSVRWPKHGLEDIIKMDVSKIGCDCALDWSALGRGSVAGSREYGKESPCSQKYWAFTEWMRNWWLNSVKKRVRVSLMQNDLELRGRLRNRNENALVSNLAAWKEKNEGASETELRANVSRSLEQMARKKRVKSCRFGIESDQVVKREGWGGNPYHLVRVYTVWFIWIR
jgi:hypothetical protein